MVWEKEQSQEQDTLKAVLGRDTEGKKNQTYKACTHWAVQLPGIDA